MALNPALFSSQKMNWKTPKKFYEELDKEFSFDFDPCPVQPGFDGLGPHRWGKVNFVNPPYGRELPKWIRRGFEEWSISGATVVFLIPSRTDTRWWHDYCMKATEIRFIKGRLYFDDGMGRAPFPSCLVVFK